MAENEVKYKKLQKVRTATDKPTTSVVLNQYVVTIGFEVNYPKAFVVRDNGWVSKNNEHTQLLDVDYGHAFFYVTKNDIVEVFFSFGPSGPGKSGWFNKGNSQAPNKWNTAAPVKDGYASSRPGTPDYGIGETATLYRIVVNEDSAKKIIAEANNVRQQIIAGDQKYTAWINDTCAETARDILSKYISNLPDGTGAIKQAGIPTLNVVNPYMWHYKFKQSIFAKPEIIYPLAGRVSGKGVISEGFHLVKGWNLKPKDKDPLVNEGYIIKK